MSKRSSEIFAAITRWVEGGAVEAQVARIIRARLNS
jgi:hypothetical protein